LPPEGEVIDPAPVTPATPSSSSTARWWALAIAAGALIGAAPLASRTWRRRRPQGSSAQQIRANWDRATDAVCAIGVELHPSLTPAEVASATAERFPVGARPMRSLADVVTSATYARNGTDGFDVAGAYGKTVLRDASNWCRQIERATRDVMSTAERVRRYFTRWR
jgi:hypothetical protein